MDFDEHLIEEVRSRPILYDLGQTDYQNLKKKEMAWREIASKLNEVECKKRWKGLRDSYKRCKRMQQITSGSSAETPKRKWRYFEALSFLDDVTSHRRTVGNIVFNDEEEFISEVIEIDPSDCFSPANTCSTSLGTKKKNDSEKFQEFLDLDASSISETCGTFATMKGEQDSTVALFSSLAKKIKDINMPPHITNRIEAKVSSLVFEEIELFYSKDNTTL